MCVCVGGVGGGGGGGGGGVGEFRGVLQLFSCPGNRALSCLDIMPSMPMSI